MLLCGEDLVNEGDEGLLGESEITVVFMRDKVQLLFLLSGIGQGKGYKWFKAAGYLPKK